ncbi:hypothetical protein P175DRAFT_0506253 [Aspergillus ochraceoroseus IBT 24754]|uniref:RTA1 domain protein n=2 Tax=Aspergillus ochraceoroseus TaxID=138278 RepID=A0A2T5M7Y1_9EURO|nr:uncharacterized protein P175DRAFT_0506253 [Aspergillus ochraceoroseus IBT 24754]KKK22836.1 hypothetical protein AOCH_003838 [Aspergillus ochraceoroseus]PTU24642.1 hypothetical protein P175DRAFT_0506253 [Aspergillus ochraceoroseus IBT 24754]
MDFTFHPGTNGSAPWVEFYPYYPSLGAGYAFTAIFGIATLVHLALMFPYRAAYFIPFFIGGICETFGYYGRARSHPDRTAIGPWAQQQMLIMCAPPLLAATVYMSLGRIIRALDAEHLSLIRTKRLTVLFVLNDVVSFLTQLVGVGIQVTGDERVMKIGLKAVLAGLIFALVVFVGFVWIAVVFHRRLRAEQTGVARGLKINWGRYMWAIYTACLMMIVRNLVRTIEFAAPKGADIRDKEVYIYVFDAATMAITMGVLAVWHPGMLVKRARSVGKAQSPEMAPLSD